MLKMFGRRPLTRLEIGLYVAIVGIAATLLLDRLLDAMEIAERSAMEQTIVQVNSALNVRLTYQMLEGKLINVPEALKRNPFELAKATPPNYRGEVEGAQRTSVESGGWVYDRSRAELIYLPRLKRHLVTSDGTGTVRFKLSSRTGGGTRYALVVAYRYDWE